jgi:hypothetical protein
VYTYLSSYGHVIDISAIKTAKPLTWARVMICYPEVLPRLIMAQWKCSLENAGRYVRTATRPCLRRS